MISSKNRDERRNAVHAAISAARRNALARQGAGAYSALIDNAGLLIRDCTMYATDTVSVAAKLAAFAVAVITSAVLLGSTVAGMQPREDALQNVASARVSVTATRTN